MRVLVTGGNGMLGHTLAPMLVDRGHTVTLLDNHEFTSPFATIVVDVRDAAALRQAFEGQDVIVHAAALHGVHIGLVPEVEFLEVNITGTYNVLQAADTIHANKVVYISSTSIYGASVTRRRRSAVYINEKTPVNPIDINDTCKLMGECLCTYYMRHHRLPCIILRLGRFFEGEWIDFNLRKLSGGVDVRDAAQAVVLSIEAGDLRDYIFCISSRTRFTKDDVKRLIGHADHVIEERYPGAQEIFESIARPLPRIVHRMVDITRAGEQLKYNPQWNFDAFLDLMSDQSLNNDEAINSATRSRSGKRQ